MLAVQGHGGKAVNAHVAAIITGRIKVEPAARSSTILAGSFRRPLMDRALQDPRNPGGERGCSTSSSLHCQKFRKTGTHEKTEIHK